MGEAGQHLMLAAWQPVGELAGPADQERHVQVAAGHGDRHPDLAEAVPRAGVAPAAVLLVAVADDDRVHVQRQVPGRAADPAFGLGRAVQPEPRFQPVDLGGVVRLDGGVEQVAEHLRGRVEVRLGRAGHRRSDEDQPGHPLRRQECGIQRQPAPGRRPHQPRGPVGEPVEHRQQIIDVRKRRPARPGPPVPPPVVCDHLGRGAQDLRGLPPSPQVGDSFVEQHEHRAVPGPALPVQFGPVQLQREGLAHAPILATPAAPANGIRAPLNRGPGWPGQPRRAWKVQVRSPGPGGWPSR